MGVSRSRSQSVCYGCINIRSVNSKFDDVMQIFRDHQLAVLGRCRLAGYSVVDHPRVRVRDDLSVNHGGVAIVAALGTSLSPLLIGSPSSTFEAVAAHFTTGQSRAAIVVVYRPGSQPVTAQFFDNLSTLLERLVILRLPLFVTGDFNVRLDRDTYHHEPVSYTHLTLPTIYSV